MPELPDVEVQRRYLEATALHQEIDQVQVNDTYVLKGLSADELKAALVGHAFESTRRHGKYLFIQLDAGGWLLLHFGMTGNLKYFKNEDQQPEYVQVRFDFSNDYHLAYIMSRKLGRVRLLEDVDAFVRDKGLGPDALSISFADFRRIIGGKHAMIKSTLMNQALLAGIGNIYSDEILFQAGVHPRKNIDELDEGQLRDVYDKMMWVLHMAIEHDAEPAQFPDSYLIPHRDEGAECPRCGGKVAKVDVSGRSSYYCPACQKL